MRGLHTKLASWLVLIAYALSAFTPGQPLLLCLEPDGSVVVEAATPYGCTPCGEEAEAADESGSLAQDCCPCVDIPLPFQDGHRGQLKGRSMVAAPAAVLPPADSVVVADVPSVSSFVARPDPRPAPGLGLIRTVVLRV